MAAGNLSANGTSNLLTTSVNIGAPFVTSGNTYPVLTNPPYNLGFDTVSGITTASFWLTGIAGREFSASITNGTNPLVILGLATNQAAGGNSVWDSGTPPLLINRDDNVQVTAYYLKTSGKVLNTKWKVTGGNVWSNQTVQALYVGGNATPQTVPFTATNPFPGTVWSNIPITNGVTMLVPNNNEVWRTNKSGGRLLVSAWLVDSLANQGFFTNRVQLLQWNNGVTNGLGVFDDATFPTGNDLNNQHGLMVTGIIFPGWQYGFTNYSVSGFISSPHINEVMTTHYCTNCTARIHHIRNHA